MRTAKKAEYFALGARCFESASYWGLMTVTTLFFRDQHGLSEHWASFTTLSGKTIAYGSGMVLIYALIAALKKRLRIQTLILASMFCSLCGFFALLNMHHSLWWSVGIMVGILLSSSLVMTSFSTYVRSLHFQWAHDGASYASTYELVRNGGVAFGMLAVTLIKHAYSHDAALLLIFICSIVAFVLYVRSYHLSKDLDFKVLVEQESALMTQTFDESPHEQGSVGRVLILQSTIVWATYFQCVTSWQFIAERLITIDPFPAESIAVPLQGLELLFTFVFITYLDSRNVLRLQAESLRRGMYCSLLSVSLLFVIVYIDYPVFGWFSVFLWGIIQMLMALGYVFTNVILSQISTNHARIETRLLSSGEMYVAIAGGALLANALTPLDLPTIFVCLMVLQAGALIAVELMIRHKLYQFRPA